MSEERPAESSSIPRSLRARRRRLALVIAGCGLVLSLAAGAWISERAEARVSAYGFAASVTGLENEAHVDWPALRWKARWEGFAAGFVGGAFLTASLALGLPRALIRR